MANRIRIRYDSWVSMKLKQFGILISPSLLSGSLTVIISVFVLLGATWTYSVGSGAIFNFLFGKSSSAELIRTSQSSVSAFNNTVFGNPTLNKILYFGFWMLVGILVYVILFFFVRGTSTAVRDVEEATYTNVNKADLFKSFAARLGLRLLITVIWVIYSIFFAQIFFPFSILAARIGLSELPHIMGWVYSPLSLVVLGLSLHIHIIFLRLLMLRVRVYDSNQ